MNHHLENSHGSNVRAIEERLTAKWQQFGNEENSKTISLQSMSHPSSSSIVRTNTSMHGGQIASTATISGLEANPRIPLQ